LSKKGVSMLKGIHFLLTYRCTNECDHCFLYCSPGARGAFTFAQIERTLDEAVKLGTVTNIYFEGGEPFLYYPLLLESVKAAHERSFFTGIVTNSYWAESIEDAEMWLKRLKDAGLDDISFSDDALHSGESGDEKPGYALEAAKWLGLSAGTICIEEPVVKIEGVEADSAQGRGELVIGGSACFKGRAADMLTEGLPVKPWQGFTACEREELSAPGRVHVDSFGNVHLCQGLSLGNMWQTPLTELMRNYDAKKHPICSHLLAGGPAQLARAFGVEVEDGYVDECHLCYNVRRKLMSRFPDILAPELVYGAI
jgi:MoaA/NifB/PqqE/SkfB family radical SAM enzyme